MTDFVDHDDSNRVITMAEMRSGDAAAFRVVKAAYDKAMSRKKKTGRRTRGK